MASADFDATSGILLAATEEHGIWCLRRDKGAWRVLQRMLPDFPHPQRVKVAAGLAGAYALADKRFFRFVNLDRLSGEGVPLADACAQPDLLNAISSPA